MSYFSKFVLQHERKTALSLTSFVLVRYKFIKVAVAEFSAHAQNMFIQLLKFYHNCIEPYVVNDKYLCFQSIGLNCRVFILIIHCPSCCDTIYRIVPDADKYRLQNKLSVFYYELLV